jgi:hypothetical protein
MKYEEMLEIWRRHKRQRAADRDFCDRVMAAIRLHSAETGRPITDLRSRLSWIAGRPWAKAAVLVVGVLAGLGRIIATVHLILLV